ncbi:DUF3159 domain-containing protein [Streptomyces sp. GZWMJZ-114]|uniref:DUF3159 domain-containing protein n=1 Tax=Streptomyces sp. GZWMJZ-114 TaxID=2494734 RepID=UPI001F50DE45|nr:DUF3159 domain-containing protein [Streptomyces sp. GZWMJZ-114]
MNARPGKNPRPTMMDQLGGPRGLLYTGLPIIAFVVANAAFGLTAAIVTAMAVAVGLAVLRLVRKESVQPAIGGIIGVGTASLVAWKTGSAKGYFLLGIWFSLAAAVVLLLSVLIRRPLAGYVWSALNGQGQEWREDRIVRRGYDIATLALFAVFAARFVVQQWLYDHDSTGWLAFARIAMGYPLLALALLVVVWAVRRATKRSAGLREAEARQGTREGEARQETHEAEARQGARGTEGYGRPAGAPDGAVRGGIGAARIGPAEGPGTPWSRSARGPAAPGSDPRI